MASTWYRNVGDTGPALAAVLKRDGVVVDLTGATDVKIRIASKRAAASRHTPPRLVAAAFGSRPAGEVAYANIALFTTDRSSWVVQFVVTDAGGNVATYPSDGTALALEVSEPV